MSVVVATAVNAEGKREIVGMDVGTSEDGAFWLSFLRSLVARGLAGVELVTSDAHEGLREAIATVFSGAGWQRCRTHFMTNLLTKVPKSAQLWVATVVRNIYQQPSARRYTSSTGRWSSSLPSASLRLRRCRSGHTGVHALPDGTLESDVVEQSVGEIEQGNKKADRCGGHLPEPIGGATADRSRACRAER